MVIKSLTGGDDVDGIARCAAHGAITLDPRNSQGILCGAWPESPGQAFLMNRY
jgi:hypothetical protein